MKGLRTTWPWCILDVQRILFLFEIMLNLCVHWGTTEKSAHLEGMKTEYRQQCCYGVSYTLQICPTKKLISAIQAMMTLLMILDLLFMQGFYQQMGVPDSFYMVIFAGFLEVLFFFKILPFSVLIAHKYPPGFPFGLRIRVVCTLLPTFWSSRTKRTD